MISSQTVLGYMCMPLAFLMGVEWNDCYYVGQMLGLKLTSNEFLSYIMLGRYARDGLISVTVAYAHSNSAWKHNV